jgi:hypothetical protein
LSPFYPLVMPTVSYRALRILINEDKNPRNSRSSFIVVSDFEFYSFSTIIEVSSTKPTTRCPLDRGNCENISLAAHITSLGKYETLFDSVYYWRQPLLSIQLFLEGN